MYYILCNAYQAIYIFKQFFYFFCLSNRNQINCWHDVLFDLEAQDDTDRIFVSWVSKDTETLGGGPRCIA